MRTFPLFMFSDGERSLITRGESVDLALGHAGKSRGLRTGSTISHQGWLPLNAPALYAFNHAPGWLYRMPEYQRREENRQLQKKIARYGFDTVFKHLTDDIAIKLKERQSA